MVDNTNKTQQLIEDLKLTQKEGLDRIRSLFSLYQTIYPTYTGENPRFHQSLIFSEKQLAPLAKELINKNDQISSCRQFNEPRCIESFKTKPR